MKKLLIVATIPETLSCFLAPFVEHFRSQGWQVEGMAQDISANAQCLSIFDRVWDIKWSRNPLDPRNLVVAVPRIKEVVAQGNYDLIHVHTPVAAFVTRYALRNWRKSKQFKLIYTAHGFHFHSGGNPITNTIFLNLEKLAGKWTDYLIVINREDEAAAKKYQILPSEQIYYTPGIGVDTNFYNPDLISSQPITKVRQELGLTSEDKLFLAVAEFTPNKRHRDMLQALAKLNRSDVHLALAGDGLIQEELEQFTFQLGLQKQVHFLGFRTDVPVLIRAAVATLLTSKREGLPRSIMEALCLETPVIGTDIRGIRDLLSGGCGILVKVGDVDGLAKAMNWIIEHPQETAEMGKKGRIKMTEYDVRQIIDLYQNIYNQTTNQANNYQKNNQSMVLK
ncbi:glycosyl transferase group 1 [Stanieria cyanosphaera PCC 7437]|uniref:Glycosyl transferase group 1 n=1 Tax=Stanieria cyanosphaera (strain ATCC 29371 / PCC 7437) TaxID=111780 RepID=K9Y123_STAC7|nr:glycosyltransferase family 4 protein [Stanieria cyanosphaera]AFZ37642.1 glycosyl transferase group 1 [Stanieria cyanosphaera PCC 7437]